MKKLWWLILFILVGVGYLWWSGSGGMMKKEEAVMAKNEIVIQNFAFTPSTITIKAGDSVTWTNKDLVGHSATADDKSFDTGVLAQGDSETVTFANPGTFSYHCTPHPNMKATVIVE